MYRFFGLIIFTLTLLGCEQQQIPAPQKTIETQPLLKPNRYAVINYWATWCKPCREEIPELNKLAKLNSHNTDIYAINFDGLQGDELRAAAQDFDIQFNIADKSMTKELQLALPNVLPTTYIFDQQGKEIAVLIGPQTASVLKEYLQ